MATDEDLMRAVAAGDGGALEELCLRYERPLYQFLVRHLGDARDAEDLHQETWLRVVRYAGRFDPARRFSTWMFQIALNLCRDWHRRRPPTPLDPDTLELPGRDTSAAAIASVDAARLLRTLPEAQREVLLLRLYHDFSEADVATMLECPPGTVKSRLHHALARLARVSRREHAPKP